MPRTHRASPGEGRLELDRRARGRRTGRLREIARAGQQRHPLHTAIDGAGAAGDVLRESRQRGAEQREHDEGGKRADNDSHGGDRVCSFGRTAG